jgi:hypothetical protein
MRRQLLERSDLSVSRFSFCLSAALTAATFSLPAAADPTAKEAYDQGIEAYKRGDLKGASQEFARADTLSPNAVSLQAALDAAIEADDAALVAELLERTKREPASPDLAASITAAHLRFEGRLSPAASSSTPPTSSTPATSTDHDRGLPPIVVYAGLGVTTILAGMTTYFAVDTSNTHDSFANAGCDQANLPECGGLKNDGESSQQLANIGFVSTVIVGLATAIIGFAYTDWRAPVLGSRRVDRTGATGPLRIRF